MNEESGTSGKARVLKVVGLLLLLLVLVVFGFFVGIYLRIFDVHKINETMRLYNLPVIGEYFVRPPDNMAEQSEGMPDAVAQPAGKTPTGGNGQTPAVSGNTPEKPTESKPILLTQAEIEKQHQEQQAAEKKRVTRLARLYGEMKPKAAADIMDALNDDVTIAILQKLEDAQAAKILAEFDPEKAARLTRVMYMGLTSRMTSPGDADNETMRPASSTNPIEASSEGR